MDARLRADSSQQGPAALPGRKAADAQASAPFTSFPGSHGQVAAAESLTSLLGSAPTGLTTPARQVCYIFQVLWSCQESLHSSVPCLHDCRRSYGQSSSEVATLHDSGITLSGAELRPLVKLYQLASPRLMWTARLLPCATQRSKPMCASEGVAPC